MKRDRLRLSHACKIRFFLWSNLIGLSLQLVRAVGLNTSGASRDDILLYRGDREALSGSLDRIQRAASVILKAVNVGG